MCMSVCVRACACACRPKRPPAPPPPARDGPSPLTQERNTFLRSAPLRPDAALTAAAANVGQDRTGAGEEQREKDRREGAEGRTVGEESDKAEDKRGLGNKEKTGI